MMAIESRPETSPESLHDIATNLIESGVVSITAVEEFLGSGLLMLSLHPALDADEESIRAVVRGVEKVRVGDRVFRLYCDIDPCGPSTLGRVTVFIEPPRGDIVSRVVPPTSLDEGIDRLLDAANSDC